MSEPPGSLGRKHPAGPFRVAAPQVGDTDPELGQCLVVGGVTAPDRPAQVNGQNLFSLVHQGFPLGRNGIIVVFGRLLFSWNRHSS